MEINRIKELRTENNIRQIDLCKQLGVSQGALSGWENGRYEPDSDMLIKLSDIFGVSIEYILGKSNTVKPTKIKKTSVKIPVLGRVKAGIPIDAIQEVIDYEEITEDMAKNGEHFALQIIGDSMEPKMHEGDVVIVRKQSDVDSGNLAIVLVNNTDATVKKIIKHENGISLMSFNNKYSPIFYSNEQLNSLPVIILGRVMELRAKF